MFMSRTFGVYVLTGGRLIVNGTCGKAFGGVTVMGIPESEMGYLEIVWYISTFLTLSRLDRGQSTFHHRCSESVSSPAPSKTLRAHTRYF